MITKSFVCLSLVGAVMIGGSVIGVVSASADEAGVPKPEASAPSPTSGTQSKAGADAQKKLSEDDPTKIVKKADPGQFRASSDPAVEMQANGMWLDKDGNPTPAISKDGKVDWFLASGFRRYGANCLQCHGPDAMGSSYAPALVDSLRSLTYAQFMQTVAAGKRDVNNSSNLVMPAFGDNKNVQCYINDIYVYIRARAIGLQGRGDVGPHESKPEIYGTQETACLGF